MNPPEPLNTTLFVLTAHDFSNPIKVDARKVVILKQRSGVAVTLSRKDISIEGTRKFPSSPVRVLPRLG